MENQKWPSRDRVPLHVSKGRLGELLNRVGCNIGVAMARHKKPFTDVGVTETDDGSVRVVNILRGSLDHSSCGASQIASAAVALRRWRRRGKDATAAGRADGLARPWASDGAKMSPKLERGGGATWADGHPLNDLLDDGSKAKKRARRSSCAT